MKINTKYNIQQNVWPIFHENRQETINCSGCAGERQIKLADDSKVNCPKCYGRGTNSILHELAWTVGSMLTIGQVRAKITNIKSDGMFDNVGDYCEDCDEYENQYMCYQTGIGSGTVHDEDHLWAAEKEAQAECDKRNTEN